jgi:hypothetical protein
MGTTVQYDITRTDHEAVERFIEGLAAFRHDEWLCVTGACAATGGKPSPSLEALVARCGLRVEAWSVADDVETAVYYSLGSRGFAPSREGASLRLARQAATTAALALMVRPLLDATEFASLYQPFASVLPVPTQGRRWPSAGQRQSAADPVAGRRSVVA